MATKIATNSRLPDGMATRAARAATPPKRRPRDEEAPAGGRISIPPLEEAGQVKASIAPINIRTLEIRLIGTAPLKQAKFSAKAKQMIRSKQEEGSTASKGKKRAPRDFDSDFKNCMHISEEGWVGVPAAALRNASIDACRMAGFKMTHAKMSIFIVADGFDADDASPLVRLDAPAAEKTEEMVRNATGVVDIRVRAMWRKWALNVKVRFDADQFTDSDVVNLMERAGVQVGIGEGRPFSKDSNGTGHGTFRLAHKDE